MDILCVDLGECARCRGADVLGGGIPVDAVATAGTRSYELQAARVPVLEVD